MFQHARCLHHLLQDHQGRKWLANKPKNPSLRRPMKEEGIKNGLPCPSKEGSIEYRKDMFQGGKDLWAMNPRHHHEADGTLMEGSIRNRGMHLLRRMIHPLQMIPHQTQVTNLHLHLPWKNDARRRRTRAMTVTRGRPSPWRRGIRRDNPNSTKEVRMFLLSRMMVPMGL